MTFTIQLLVNLGGVMQSYLPSFQSEHELEALLFHYGWDVDLDENTFAQGINQITALSEAFIDVAEKMEEWIGNEEEEAFSENEEKEQKEKSWTTYLKELYPLVKKVYEVIIKLKDIENKDDNIILPEAFKEDGFWADITERLLEDILVLTLQRHYPLAYGFLHLFGIIEYKEMEPEGAYRINYTRTDINWGRLVDFIQGPDELFQEAYQWGKDNGDFQWDKLLHTLERAFLANRFLVRYILPRRSVVEGFTDSADFADYEKYVFEKELHELQIPFIYGTSVLDESFYNIGLGLMPVARKTNGQYKGEPEGLIITPVLLGNLSHSFFISPEIALKLGAGLDANNSLAVKLFPDDVQLVTNGPEVGLSIGLSGAPFEPWIIVGSTNSHRMALGGFELTMLVEGSVTDPEVKLYFRTLAASSEERGVNVVIDLEESDSFVVGAAKTNQLEAGFDLEIEWSNKTGFRIAGDASFDLQWHLNKKLGPIEIEDFYLSLTGKEQNRSSQKAVQFRTGLGLKGDIGPLKFYLKNTGFALDIIPFKASDLQADSEPPALGLLDLALHFAPPQGLGFILDAKAVKGGGFLEFKDGEYIGFAELEIFNKVNVKAIGIINTQMPDGREGYSFLLMILTEFNPIQLGLGFTLQGVGGIIGLHRGLHLENIITGVREDKFDYLLFPEDPLTNLPKIMVGLDEIMPIQQDHYAFGIMCKIGWGTPMLIEIKLGLVFEIPNWKLALIGVAKAEIKAKKKTLVRLQLNFAITYDPDVVLFTVDASLINSRFLSWDLEGDFAVRIRGGEDPYFLISAGGFHKDFIQPEGLRLPPMRRLKITMADGNPDIYAAMFFAITSNTIQFGAAAHASYKVAGIGFEADLGFEALIQFDPLYFKVEVWGGVYLIFYGKSFGLDLRGTVEGPYPLKISLYVKFKIWIFSFTVRVPTITIGKSRESRLEGIPIWPKLEEQLRDYRNWQAYLPPNFKPLVSIHSIPDAGTSEESKIKFHPIGGIQIDQSRVPLNIKLQKFGNHRPTDFSRFSLIVKNEHQLVEWVQQHFAPTQFFELTEEERFKRKSYEKYDSGIRLSNWDKIEGGAVVEKEFEYEENIIDPEYFDRFLESTSIAQSSLGQEQDRKASESKEPIRRKRAQYALVNTMTMEEIAWASSESEAQLLLEEKIKIQPELEDQLEIMPLYELV